LEAHGERGARAYNKGRGRKTPEWSRGIAPSERVRGKVSWSRSFLSIRYPTGGAITVFCDVVYLPHPSTEGCSTTVYKTMEWMVWSNAEVVGREGG